MLVKDIQEGLVYTDSKTKRKVLKIYGNPLRVEYEIIEGKKGIKNCKIEVFASWAKFSLN